MPVITRFGLARGAASGLQPGHADPGAGQSARIGVGHRRVGEDVEYLIEQTAPVDLDVCARSTRRRLSSWRARESARPALGRAAGQLVEDLDVGFGQRRQQDRLSTVDIGVLQRHRTLISPKSWRSWADRDQLAEKGLNRA